MPRFTADDDIQHEMVFRPGRDLAGFEEDVRCCLTIEPDFVLIVAVMHCSREPGYWKQRLTKP